MLGVTFRTVLLLELETGSTNILPRHDDHWDRFGS